MDDLVVSGSASFATDTAFLGEPEPTPRPPFVHPETGELLETEADFRRALDANDEAMQPYWRIRRRLQEELGERFAVELPSRRDRTAKQEIIAHCPRCRRAISEDDAYEVALVERLRRDRRR